MWYRLAEELSKMKDSDLCNTFHPYIEKLISELSRHCQIDEDTSSVSSVSVLSYMDVYVVYMCESTSNLQQGY